MVCDKRAANLSNHGCSPSMIYVFRDLTTCFFEDTELVFAVLQCTHFQGILQGFSVIF